MNPVDMLLLALSLIATGQLILILKMRSTLKRWKTKVRRSERIVRGAMRNAGSEL